MEVIVFISKEIIEGLVKATVKSERIFDFTVHCVMNGISIETLNRDEDDYNIFNVSYIDPEYQP